MKRNADSARRYVALAAILFVGLPLSSASAASSVPATASTAEPTLLHASRVTAQDVAPQPGSEADTVVEPDVAISPVDRNIAVAASHDGRYPDGGAVGISYAWTHNGGASWQHQPLPGITVSTGGPKLWIRASDPVVAFGPDGDVYISTLLIAQDCASAVAVSRSVDGGVVFGAPVLAHFSAKCSVSDDKNTLIVDNSPTSPHRGRIYQFWTPFLTDPFGNSDGSPQALVISDDHGAHWSRPINVSQPHANTQNSTPMLLPDGTVVDAYIDYGSQSQDNEDIAFRQNSAKSRTARVAGVSTPPQIRTAISTDGGAHFHTGGVVTSDLGDGPTGIRCCLPSATADAQTGRLYVGWNSVDRTQVKLASSADGVHWTAPIVVSPNLNSAEEGVNVDVAAFGGVVSVSFGLTHSDAKARFAQQYLAVSRNGGATFIAPMAVGPRSNYTYAAQAGGIFPGDYIGTAMSDGRLYAVWCVSSKPSAGGKYHQVVYGASVDVANR